MRIGLDARELQGRATGVGRYVLRLLQAWPSASGDQLFAYFNGPAPVCPTFGAAPVQPRPLGARPLRGLLWQETRLPAAAREDGLDVFFAPGYSCPLRLDLPRVTTLHDMSFFAIPQDFPPLDGWRRRALARASVRASRRVIAVSDFTRREIHAWIPEAEGRVEVIPHGADAEPRPAEPRDAARARLGVGGPLLLAVGSVLNRRHLPELLRATASLARRHPSLVLDVVGENRTHPRLDLGGLVERLGLTRRVRLSGFISDAELACRYAAADALVYLSDYEGFGMPVLEGLARGLPVVAGDRPALSELFAGLAQLVDPRDVVGIARALDGLLASGGRAERAAAGRAFAARHSWSLAAARTREVLAEAAGV